MVLNVPGPLVPSRSHGRKPKGEMGCRIPCVLLLWYSSKAKLKIEEWQQYGDSSVNVDQSISCARSFRLIRNQISPLMHHQLR